MGLKIAALALAVIAAAEARPQRRLRKPADGRYNSAGGRKTGAGVINVHLVPHSHDDVGWLKNPDEYHYGARNDIQRAGVQNVLNAVVKELAWNPARKFIFVEQAFFQRWWAEQGPAIQNLTRALVASGQLEFVNGGWTMEDEANPSFVDMIDQTTLGHREIIRAFGDLSSLYSYSFLPKSTWQIDPFGHSTFQASMMSAPIAGFNSVLWARSDSQEIPARDARREEEFIWAPSKTLGLNSATYGGLLWRGYCTSLPMDMGGNDDPVMDDPTLEGNNIASIVDAIVADALSQNTTRPQGNQNQEIDVIFPLGCDFAWENAGTWFTNTDKVIHYLNLDGRVNAFYSTPSIYTSAKLQAGRTYSVNTYDLFPYSDCDHCYWTGYFVSRASLKGYIRESSSVFQAAKQVQLFAGGAPGVDPTNPLYRFERSMGVVQHHDAVAGTAKQAVTYDYARRVAWGREDADALFSSAFARLTGSDASTVFASCDLANATICPALEGGKPTVLVIYNSQAQARAGVPVRVPVGFPAGVATYAVADNTGAAVTAQLLPLSDVDGSLRTKYYNYSSTVAVQWLAFQVASLPPAGYVAYFIVPGAAPADAPATHPSLVTTHAVGAGAPDVTLTNGVLTLTYDGAAGTLTTFANGALSTPLSQSLWFYYAFPGTQKDGQASGAYIFRPNSSETFPVSGGAAVTLTTFTGPVVNEARQTYSAWGTQVTRLWTGSATAELEYTVGPIPYADGWGREVIARYDTPLATNKTWYSDSNGRDTMTRVRNYRPYYNLTVTEPVSGNYVPINLFAYISDVNTGATLSVVTDRSQGCASIADGSLEVMLQRRLQHDDGRGVGEPLNETGLDGHGIIIRTTHWLTLDAAGVAGRNRRANVADALYRPVVRFAPLPAGATPSSWVASHKASFTGVSAPLPANLHLLTAHSWGPTSLLLRISHSFEAGEDATLSQPATVSLNGLLNGVTLTSCTETTLSGNQPLATAPQVTYAVEGGGPKVVLPIVPAPPAGNGMTVTLDPLTIRTFLCTTAPQDAAWGRAILQREGAVEGF